MHWYSPCHHATRCTEQDGTTSRRKINGKDFVHEETREGDRNASHEKRNTIAASNMSIVATRTYIQWNWSTRSETGFRGLKPGAGAPGVFSWTFRGGIDMGFDQSGTSVFCIVPGKSGQWEVKEEGFEKALASFDEQEDALEYAQDLAETKDGSTVKVYDEQGDEI
jgi:hypothetical protein